MKRTRHIQLIEKENGKIVKSQSMTLDEFRQMISGLVSRTVAKEIPFFAFRGKIIDMITCEFFKNCKIFVSSTMSKINEAIDRDNRGRTKK